MRAGAASAAIAARLHWKHGARRHAGSAGLAQDLRHRPATETAAVLCTPPTYILRWARTCILSIVHKLILDLGSKDLGVTAETDAQT